MRDNGGEFKYKVCDLDKVVDEKGSAFIALRKIAWNTDPDEDIENISETEIKVDIRKYYTTADGGEKMNKGVSFLTEEGVNELTHSLLEAGYGDSGKCLSVLKDRSDWKEAITFAYGLESEDDPDEFFDPRKLLDSYNEE